jgi:diguanylate cyclase (GGDEF)-like protein
MAVSMCERQIPDLVLMDAMMPMVDGFAACKRIRELPSGDRVPVLIVTALEDDHSIEKAFASGATDYIPKPVHFGVLRQRVGRLLEAGRAERHVRHLAYHDTLTGLPNRALFTERLGELLIRSRSDTERLAVLFLDLDRFKLVNDTLGHDVGDLLLKAVSERIKGGVRSCDLVARLGGDEFIVILDGVRSLDVVATIAEKIWNVLSEPFVFMGQEMYITTSIGISVFPDDGKDTSELMKRADTAMFRAKDSGVRFQFYEHGMEAQMSRRLAVETELRRALERDELVLHYQPQAQLATGKIVGMEALVRWQHPERGLLPPSEFISVAEDTGLIVQVGEWVLRQACMQLKAWHDKGYRTLKMAVNLSCRQLGEDDLPDSVSKTLEEVGLPARFLELEITESTIMNRAEAGVHVLGRLKDLGVQLSIDDFGTGYSSLSSLKRFPVDMLKIDRSFVRDSASDPDDAAIIAGIVALARSLRLITVAEGVETFEQHKYLRDLRCDLMQGYYLSEPLAAAVFEERILSSGLELPTIDDGKVAHLQDHLRKRK